MNWKKLETFDSIYFSGRSHFEDDDTQNWLVLQPTEWYVKKIASVSNGRYFITFITGNLKNCLMKKLILLKDLIIALLQT